MLEDSVDVLGDVGDRIAMESHVPKNKDRTPTFGELLERRWSRRAFLESAALVAGGIPLAPLAGCRLFQESTSAFSAAASGEVGAEPFSPVGKEIGDKIRVPEGYRSQVLVRWGDPILSGAPSFDPSQQKAESQLGQFGYNCDFIAYIPLDDSGESHGLLCVNHEYATSGMMFSGFPDRPAATLGVDGEQAAAQAASVGHSVVEVRREGDQWRVVQGRYNRRISLSHTEMDIRGPAAGHPRLQTKADPSGTKVMGTMANCSGGVTPWGTILTCEENIHRLFSGEARGGPEDENHARYQIFNQATYPYHRFDERFLVNEHPHEPNRFGWVVEFDPKDPTSRPVKRTSLGRFLREGAGVVLDKSGHVVIYSGDDDYFEYIYRWVSDEPFDPARPGANKNLLDAGTLSVARCDEKGALHWLPLAYGQGGLDSKNGFASQADVLIEARRAADIVGATPMDRPEAIQISPTTGLVYAMLTKGKKGSPHANPANPRPGNPYGHILEMIPPGQNGEVDHRAATFRWDLLLLAGDPTNAEHQARYHAETNPEDCLSNPDNAVFDSQGRLWIASDGAQFQLGLADGLWLCAAEGAERALPRRFLSVPRGAECTGPCFTPGETTLFISVQHPGTDYDTTFDRPNCRWPDFEEGMPPRPSVVAITRKGGRKITD